MKLKSVLTGSAAVAALMAASSANASGYYISVFGGIATMDDGFAVSTSSSGFERHGGYAIGSYLTSVSFDFGSGSQAAYSYSVTGSFTDHSWSAVTSWSEGFDSGYVVGASLGWDFGTNWRTELEFAYRWNDVDSGARVHFTGTAASTVYGTYTGTAYIATSTTALSSVFAYSNPNTTIVNTNTNVNNSTDGEIKTMSFMANVWYDFDFGDSRFRPFIGGGIGLAQVDLEYRANLAYNHISHTYGPGDDDWGFAYQVGAGLGYEFDNGIVMSAQYRYFATGEVQLGTRDAMSLNVESQNFLIGLTFPIGGGM